MISKHDLVYRLVNMILIGEFSDNLRRNELI